MKTPPLARKGPLETKQAWMRGEVDEVRRPVGRPRRPAEPAPWSEQVERYTSLIFFGVEERLLP